MRPEPGFRLTFGVQLWDGGRAVAEAKRLNAVASELEARARETTFAIKEATRAALEQQAHAARQLSLAHRLVTVSEARVAHATSSYELGAGGLEAIADARAALRGARSRVIQLQIARVRAVLRLRD